TSAHMTKDAWMSMLKLPSKTYCNTPVVINDENDDRRVSAVAVKGSKYLRLHQALFPPGQEKMESLYQEGYDDAIHFLLKEN
ncbi:hypothetical protein JRQ81_019140, partial [Phrynocephalus forsythii]